MNWILQQPLVIIVAMLVAELILFLILQQTGKKWVVGAMGAVALLLIAGVAVERLVVTPEEAIRATLYDIAADLQRNDVDAVLAHISRRTPEKRRNDARTQIKPVKFEEVKVKGVTELKVTDPTHASALVRVKAVGSLAGYPGTEVRELALTFVLEDGRWKVRDWEDLGNPLLPERSSREPDY